MQVVLHIGTDKTGSTSIQNTLFLNRDWLADRSIYVPVTGLGEGNGHATLLSRLDAAELAGLAAELESARASGMAQALLSWEGMASLRFGRSKMRRLVAALGAVEIRVLVYLREQAQIIQSGHLQQVKRNRNLADIRSLVRPRTPWQAARAFVLLRNPNRNYYRLLRRWQREIPGATFAVRIFDRSRLEGGDVVTDFLGQLGLQRNDDFVPARDNYNESLDVEAAMLIESLQSQSACREDMNTLVDIIQSVLAVEGRATRYFLDEATVAAIRRHFRRSNGRLARRFMANGSYPFPETAACWCTDSMEQVEAGARSLARRVEQLRSIPTLMAAASGADLATRVELVAGWSAVAPWGCWSVGGTSRIRFRIFRHRLVQEVSALLLVVEGRYYGSNTATRVKINQVDFGEQSLLPGHCALLLPLDALQPFEVLDIRLDHMAPVSPMLLEGANDRRELAFGMEKIAYRPVKTRELAEVRRIARLPKGM